MLKTEKDFLFLDCFSLVGGRVMPLRFCLLVSITTNRKILLLKMLVVLRSAPVAAPSESV
jgi:hypothetical protein